MKFYLCLSNMYFVWSAGDYPAVRRTPRQCPTRGWAQPEKLISALPACQRGRSRRLRWVNPARTVAERPPMWTRLLASPLPQDSAATTGRSLEECATTSGRPPEKGRPSRNLAGEPASRQPPPLRALTLSRPAAPSLDEQGTQCQCRLEHSCCKPKVGKQHGPQPPCYVYPTKEWRESGIRKKGVEQKGV